MPVRSLADEAIEDFKHRVADRLAECSRSSRQLVLVQITSGHRKSGAFCCHDLLRALDRPESKVVAIADFQGFHDFS
ncbi:hypothetical protein GOC91_05535 [Sinorhizobium medicae]|uniref:Uncharacterized protein n=2 Tax=Sinorhizobium medicae TaxID=110321 RepID=A0A6G1WK79_9HYPH|nr:hypothetical protein Smed_5269 [Sinorhizobium medicae WSM419]MDX0404784.1 hypothetical protein [Sinorhizobium medicae]MDX0411777.1 hypothetical protein [Sinorhizobium medicae]MDX0416906.1 hypothetical protein [Sinorhizobium medicae]MDX0424253.1 hypothetical protein [Sinorhizobium medicae]